MHTEDSELERTEQLGRGDRWEIASRYSLAEGWLSVSKDGVRRYAPLEHPELPSQFGDVWRGGDGALIRFASRYGHLGFEEFFQQNPDDAYRLWVGLEDREARQADGPFRDEPLAWVHAHSQTIDWCLRSAALLDVGADHTSATWKDLVDSFPEHLGLGMAVDSGQSRRAIKGWEERQRRRARRRNEPPLPRVRDQVNLVVARILNANLRGVRRVVYVHNGRLVSRWGGWTLLESIYTLVADSVTGGAIGRCRACGGGFVKTDERQKFCPPSIDQDKSTCGTRYRVRAYREGQARLRRKELRDGKQTTRSR